MKGFVRKMKTLETTNEYSVHLIEPLTGLLDHYAFTININLIWNQTGLGDSNRCEQMLYEWLCMCDT